MSAPTPAAPLLSAEGLVKAFDTRKGLFTRLLRRRDYLVRAVNGVGLSIRRGETLGLIGESGCGKSTLGRVLLRLQEPTAGRVSFDGIDLLALPPEEMKRMRRRMQIIFQDPYASLNPRKTVAQIVGLPVWTHERCDRSETRERVAAMLGRVGLAAAHLNRFPHQFSGGQRQRIGIARALVVRPDFVVCDEPVSALDVSIQAQILHLLEELKGDLNLTYLFISHNLSVVGYISDRIAVMYLGEIVETGAARELLGEPLHPYTQALLSALPRLEAGAGRPRIRLGGDPPSPLAPPPGCRFHPRCPHAMAVCRAAAPAMTRVSATRAVACHLHGGGTGGGAP